MIAYAITDPTTLNFQTLSTDLQRFSNNADMIVYRDKSTHTYAQNAKRFITEAKKYPFNKVLLHSNVTLAYQLKADGIHLTSIQFSKIEEAKKLGLFVVISTHTLQEAKRAEILGADMITFSAIFKTPNKGEPKGVAVLQEVVTKLSLPVIALGGIVTAEHIDQCEQSGAGGFASIRYFG
ncbi:MAG TPA: thiamine phosphate synthase [Campylobacterales bacterium]|nr:thiamine phosphate synthase [Campylobacterales bacterium]HIP41930.1 thiamine phosphate synthase [Campylobacterales bacterium]